MEVLKIKLLLMGLLFVILVKEDAFAKEYLYGDSSVKAAYIYNFTNFVNWPKEYDEKNNICIIGDDTLGVSVAVFLKEKKESLVAKKMFVDSDLGECKILFINHIKVKEIQSVLERVKRQPILTIGDTEGFVKIDGGMIEFLYIGSKLKFRINAKFINQAGLHLSAMLLDVAHEVIDNE